MWLVQILDQQQSAEQLELMMNVVTVREPRIAIGQDGECRKGAPKGLTGWLD
jgi:hypothetical protein